MLPETTLAIIQSLNKNDFKKLGHFIRSPYFNSKESLCRLYDEVAKQFPDFKPQKFEYKKIYKKVFGHTEYKEQTIKNLYSDFGNILKKFVAHEKLERSRIDFNRMLIQGLYDIKCHAQSEKIIQFEQKQKTQPDLSEEEHIFYKYQLAHFNYNNMLNLNRINLDEFHSVFNSINNNLAEFFLGTFYFYINEDFLLTKAHKTEIDLKSLEQTFIDSFDAENFFSRDHVSAYLKIRYLNYKYHNGISDKEYKQFESLIKQNIDSFSIAFKASCWHALINLLLLHLVPKDKKYYKEALEINNYFIEQNLYPNEYFPLGLSCFRNCIGIAIVLKEYEWAEKFVIDHSKYLIEEAKENELNYSLGRLMFQQKKYEKSLEYLGKVKYQQVEEKMNVRFYYLMNYIELRSYTSAVAMLNSTRQFYLESKELPEMFAVLTENSLKFFREIIRAEENSKKLDYAVYKEAQAAGRYYQKQYILNKMESLL